MPPQLSRVELTKMFGDIFQIILPDTPSLATEDARVYVGDEYEVDAMDDFCRSLSNRQMLHRVSDRQMMRGISDVTRSISLLDDPSGQHKSTYPRIYVLNCRACHFAGDTQLNYAENLEFPVRLFLLRDSHMHTTETQTSDLRPLFKRPLYRTTDESQKK